MPNAAAAPLPARRASLSCSSFPIAAAPISPPPVNWHPASRPLGSPAGAHTGGRGPAPGQSPGASLPPVSGWVQPRGRPWAPSHARAELCLSSARPRRDLPGADGTSDLVKNLFRFQRRPVTHDPRGRPAAAAAPPLHTVPGGYAYRRRTAAVHSRQLSANWPCLVRFSVTVPPSREPCGSSQARAVSLDDLSSASPACGHREPVKADMVSTGTSVGPVSRPGRSARVMLCPPPGRPALPAPPMGRCKTNKSSQGRADAQ
ncbi:hypothetical protein N7456_012547 [Penicillium angulare]|uniref:Uncharacterized protein n=1 Tax=Penicillium angulare TaxID=116970 RepID=A0A9W9EJZ7_9EURO|nr:hypothetical protein N7456_012547 [Penicillium angulare]